MNSWGRGITLFYSHWKQWWISFKSWSQNYTQNQNYTQSFSGSWDALFDLPATWCAGSNQKSDQCRPKKKKKGGSITSFCFCKSCLKSFFAQSIVKTKHLVEILHCLIPYIISTCVPLHSPLDQRLWFVIAYQMSSWISLNWGTMGVY